MKTNKRPGLLFFNSIVPMVLIMMGSIHFTAFSCGGGVVPYVPSQTGAGGNASLSGEFFLMEKGVATDMFDVKKLQPLFRNIVLSGNERKIRKSKKKKTVRVTSLGDGSDMIELKSDSLSQKKETSKSEITPILRLHRIH